MKRLLNIIAWSFLSTITYAQSDSLNIFQNEINFERLIEDAFAIQDEDINYEDLYESLLQIYLNPIDINAAGRQELQSLYILSELQINRILQYREKGGGFLSLYELQSVPDLDVGTIERLLPFITLNPRGLNDPLQKRLLTQDRNFFIARHERTLQQKRGFMPVDTNSRGQVRQRYLGSPDKLYSRLRVSNPNNFTVGFTVEKDPGEQIIWDPATNRYGADFWSAHILLQNKGNFKNILLGDYQLQFGQGLLWGAGFGIGRGAETITTVRRSNLGIIPYTSVMETGFFRGAATTYQLENIEITGFYSNRNIDGKKEIADSLEVHNEYFSSIYTSGLHRTPNEVSAKGAINEETQGAVVIFKSTDRRLNIGTGYMQSIYNIPLLRPERVYNQYEFSGSRNHNYTLFFNYYWSNFNFFAETAKSLSGGDGTVAGFIASLSSSLEMSFLIRSYTPDFHSFYGNAFRKNSRIINEKGTYWGIKYTPSNKFFLTAYYDKFEFPWLKYQVYAPSHGYEYLVRANYRPSKTVLLYAQYREEEKGANYNEGPETFIPILQGFKRNYLINLDYQTSSAVSLKSRVQFSSYKIGNNESHGFAIVQDLNCNLNRFRFSSRIALFDTNDYINRQYVYERNVLYAFSLPAYYGRGVRKYLLLQCNLSRRITFWARYSITNFRDRETIGSGLEMIEGSERSEVSCQLRLRF